MALTPDKLADLVKVQLKKSPELDLIHVSTVGRNAVRLALFEDPDADVEMDEAQGAAGDNSIAIVIVKGEPL